MHTYNGKFQEFSRSITYAFLLWSPRFLEFPIVTVYLINILSITMKNAGILNAISMHVMYS